MDKPKETSLKRLWKTVVAVSVAVGGVVGVASNLTSVLTFFHFSGPTKTESSLVANLTPQKPKAAPQEQPVANTTNSVTQASSGSQSPNLNGIHGSLDLRYHNSSNEAHASQPTPGAKAKTEVKVKSPVIQVSTGPESPNISNVGGDVKLNYESKTTPAAAQD
jgi:hypothetical protein